MLREQMIEILVVALTAIHFHLLGRFPDAKCGRPLAGRRSTPISGCGRGFRRPSMGQRLHVVPITGRRHQLNVFEYIRRHVDEGAWVWTFREGLYWRQRNAGLHE